MALATLSINESDDTGNGSYRQKLGEKDKEVVEKPWDDHVFAAKSLPIGDVRCSLSGDAGVFPLFANAGPRAKLGLSNPWTEDGDVHPGSFQLVFERGRE